MKKIRPISGATRTLAKPPAKKATAASSLKAQRRPTDTAVKKKIEKALKRLHPMD